MMSRFRFVLGFLLLGGCWFGPSVSVDSVVFLGTAPAPRDVAAPVRIYRAVLPRCDFEEIGLVRVHSGKLATAAEAMRRRAREMGGEAIIGFGSSTQVSGGSTTITTTVPDSGTAVTSASFSPDVTDVVTGTVIRFLKPGCGV